MTTEVHDRPSSHRPGLCRALDRAQAERLPRLKAKADRRLKKQPRAGHTAKRRSRRRLRRPPGTPSSPFQE